MFLVHIYVFSIHRISFEYKWKISCTNVRTFSHVFISFSMFFSSFFIRPIWHFIFLKIICIHTYTGTAAVVAVDVVIVVVVFANKRQSSQTRGIHNWIHVWCPPTHWQNDEWICYYVEHHEFPSITDVFEPTAVLLPLINAFYSHRN